MVMQFNYSATTESKYKNLFGTDFNAILVLAFASFFVPFAFGHSTTFPNQLIIGSFVNLILALAAFSLSFKKIILIILLPAIAALLSGAIFGQFSMFLVYLMPFIWFGNGVYVFSIKNLKVVNKINFPTAIIASSFLKAAAIFIPTLVLFYLGIVPEIFLAAMGIVQFATATIGGLASGIIFMKK